MIKRFNEVEGRCIEPIVGQNRFVYAQSESDDFYGLVEWAQEGGYHGSIIIFYDLETGAVYKPFPKKRNVLYSNPIFSSGAFYFLQGNYNERIISLYQYIPGELLEKVTELNTEEVNMYNLRLIGNPVHIISQEDKFECYYPEKISFPIGPRESVMFMDDGKVYISAWAERERNSKTGSAEDSQFYDLLIVKDYDGNTLSEETGSLYQAQDGTWWIA